METIAKYNDNITCQNCHQADNPAELRPLRNDWIRAMGEDADKASKEGQVCGQCHCDYSMDAPWDKDGEPTSPYYGGLDSMVPDKAMEFYDEYDFADWTYASTGAKMLAVRHAEYEFCYGGEGNHMTNLGYDCSDCHMAVEVDENGEAYHSHNLISPLDNPELIANTCSQCHYDLVSEVRGVQEKIETRTYTVGYRLEYLTELLAKAVADGQYTDEQLDPVRSLARDAQFYWDFVFVENAEGAHNPALTNQCLDKADELCGQATDMILKLTRQQAA